MRGPGGRKGTNGLSATVGGSGRRGEGAAPGNKAERPELAEATHTLRLRDGRVLRGRLISREGGAIAFAAHVASTEVEMRFADSEVEAVDEIQ